MLMTTPERYAKGARISADRRAARAAARRALDALAVIVERPPLPESERAQVRAEIEDYLRREAARLTP